MTRGEKRKVKKRAKAIKDTFGNRSMFSAIKYILLYGY